MNEPLSAAVPSVPRAFRKPSKRFLSLFWGAIVLFTVVPGGLVIRCALNSDNTIGERIALLAVACGLLFFPARIAFVTLRRLWAIGTWKISDEERLKNRAKWANPKAWKRIDLMFGLLSLELATVFTITAAEKVHDLVHSHFHGVDTWFDAVFYVLLAVYWLADLFFEYVKGKGFTVTSSVLTPLFTLCAVKYVLDLVHAQFQSVSAWCFAIFWVLFAGSHLWGLIRKYLKKIGTSSGKQPDPSNA